MSAAAIGLFIFQLPFIYNFFANVYQAWRGRYNVGANPWQATTLEWAAATSPPLGHGNFAVPPVVHRGPYEYSLPAMSDDYLPQNADDSGLVPAPVVAPPHVPVVA
jgi:cytochrome c oxidase subunit 1